MVDIHSPILCNPVFCNLILLAPYLWPARIKEQLWLHLSRLTCVGRCPAKGRTHAKWWSGSLVFGFPSASPVLSSTILFHILLLQPDPVNYLSILLTTSDLSIFTINSEEFDKVNFSFLWLFVALYLYCPHRLLMCGSSLSRLQEIWVKNHILCIFFLIPSLYITSDW